MKTLLGLILLATVAAGFKPAVTPELLPAAPQKVFVVPVREDISAPLTYLVRRGVKAAMDAGAEVLVIDMETNGGLVSVTEEIIEIIGQFKGTTITYVNRKAFSAGAFISFATQKIYMAPQSVIGAAAPILMSPGGAGVQAMDDTLEAKTVSAISALVRANAEKNGHNVEVADAMVKKTKELVIDGITLNEKGQILTLTDKEAATEYGSPPRPLLSLGTVETMDDLMKLIAPGGVQVTHIEATGAEQFAFWLNAISPILLIIGGHRRLHRVQDARVRDPGHRRHLRVCALLPRRLRGRVVGTRMGGFLRDRIGVGGAGVVRVPRHHLHRPDGCNADPRDHHHGDGGLLSRHARGADIAATQTAVDEPADCHRRCGGVDPRAQPDPAANGALLDDGVTNGQRHRVRGLAGETSGGADGAGGHDALAVASRRQGAVRRGHRGRGDAGRDDRQGRVRAGDRLYCWRSGGGVGGLTGSPGGRCDGGSLRNGGRLPPWGEGPPGRFIIFSGRTSRRRDRIASNFPVVQAGGYRG
ncbi:MAG: hypothetical protein HC814_01680 [Rhodobacteraceae bacterium]|nr:hypothetical protein [Paracoccaceae bacterium]